MGTIIIKSESEFSLYVDDIKQQRILAVDTETTGLDPHHHKIRLVQLAWKEMILIIDCFSFLPKGHDLLKAVLETPSIKILQNAKFDLQFFMAIGMLPPNIFDTMLAAQILAPLGGPKRFNLGELARYYLNDDVDKTLQKSDWSKKLTDEQLIYAGKDVEVLLRLYKVLTELIYERKLTDIAAIEFRCVFSVAQMEYYGIKLDTESWTELTKRIEDEKKETIDQLNTFTDTPTYTQMTLWGEEEIINNNFDSNSYVLSLLHKHDIPVENTSKYELSPYRKHPLVIALTRYRTASKMLSSFLRPMTQMLSPDTHRLHPKYGQISAVSGRMSCYSPNIQQIPRSLAYRKCFVAPEGRMLLIADYSQIELRVVAQITQDKRMLEAYRNGEDLHSLTASFMLNKPVQEINKEERQYAKAVNFGLIYAMGSAGLCQYALQSYGVELSLEQAEKFRKLFFEAYPGVRRWHNQLNHQQSIRGQTISGRKFMFPQGYGLPMLSNTPVQGTAADILKKALGDLAYKLRGTDAYIIATVHDEILMECPGKDADYYARMLKDTMENASNSILRSVPMEVEVSIGQSWSEK
ncbi:MAG TPA: bifunctional 3'-5' exonuclease/DNA polymerase [Candidatus Pelethocola excrementipullorum]|nr:bifunctional 3'-5' exonuclease/DNA polymerase [Candidatus Pelethocola excrementipullorum]